MSHFCRICPTFFAFCFGVSGDKRLKPKYLHDIFRCRGADGRDSGSFEGGLRSRNRPVPGEAARIWWKLCGRTQTAWPKPGSRPRGNESAGRLPTLGGRRPAGHFGAIEPPSRWRWEWRLEPTRRMGGPANSQPQPVVGQEFHNVFATVFRHTHDEAGRNLPR
jgi:hypothetical protein